MLPRAIALVLVIVQVLCGDMQSCHAATDAPPATVCSGVAGVGETACTATVGDAVADMVDVESTVAAADAAGPPATLAGSGSAREALLHARLARRAAERAAREIAAGVGVTAVDQPRAMLALMPPADVPRGDVAAAGLQVLPLTLGLRVAGGVCSALLPRGSPLPARAVRLFTTTQDNQPSARLDLYLGERAFCDDENRFLGSFELAPLPERSYRSFVQIEVTVDVDVDGIVTCRAIDLEGRALGESHGGKSWRGSLWQAAIAAPAFGGDGSSGEISEFSDTLAKHLPVLLSTRSVRLFGGRDVTLRQHSRGVSHGEQGGGDSNRAVGTGGVLWEAAIVLADYVGRNRSVNGAAVAAGSRWRGRRVLELGAGTGLVAIALAAEGASVCATDGNPMVLEGARRNVEGISALEGNISFELFDWNSLQHLRTMQELGPWDAIVGSDLVYPGNAGRRCVGSNIQQAPAADEAIMSLLDALASAGTEVIFAFKDRTGEVARFLNLVRAPGGNWDAEAAPAESIMPEFRSVGNVAVLRLRRRS